MRDHAREREDVTLGKSLKAEREARGVALESIADATKISMRHLRALEQDRFNELPGGVFARGIVQGYCRFVGIEEQPWLDRFQQVRQASDPDWTEFAEAVKRGRVASPGSASRRWWGVLLMVAALGLLSWAAWHFVVRPRVRQAPVMPPSAGLQR